MVRWGVAALSIRKRTPDSRDDEEILTRRFEVLERYRDDGWLLLGISWHPEVAEKLTTDAEVKAGFARLRELSGVDIEIEGPPAPGRAAGVLVPKTAAGPWSGLHPAASARPSAVPLRRDGFPGSGFRAPARVPGPERRHLLRPAVDIHGGSASRFSTMDPTTLERFQTVGTIAVTLAAIACGACSREPQKETASVATAESPRNHHRKWRAKHEATTGATGSRSPACTTSTLARTPPAAP